MDAFNLATTFCPNLLSGSSVIQDMQMCAIVGAPTISLFSEVPDSVSLGNAKPSTLGLVIKICIEHYFDIFEEHYDRTMGDTMRPSISQSAELDGLSANSPRTPDKKSRLSQKSPSTPLVSSSLSRGAASIQHEKLNLEHSPISTNSSPLNPRGVRRFGDSPSVTESFSSISPASPIGSTVRLPAGSSVISIEGSPDGRRGSGSIRIGRGVRKASGAGAGVEAYGVTAVGSFSPPYTSHPE